MVHYFFYQINSSVVICKQGILLAQNILKKRAQTACLILLPRETSTTRLVRLRVEYALPAFLYFKKLICRILSDL